MESLRQGCRCPHLGTAVVPCAAPSRFWPAQLTQRGNRACLWRRATSRDLWDYQDSCVQAMNLDTLKALHRLSYGHRGRRSVVVVVYDPDDAASQQVEQEVEHLATGLQYEPQVLVAKLNVRTAHQAPGSRSGGSGPAATMQFLASVTEISSLPVVLLYPEGAPGLMRYQVPGPLTASALCSALNSCQAKVLPGRPPLQLPTTRAEITSASGAGQLPTAVAGQQQQQRQGTATATTVAAPAPLWNRPGSYWSASKVWFWTSIAVMSVALLVWERWLGPAWELRALAARQRARASGPEGAEQFDTDTNLDDLYRLKLLADNKNNDPGSSSSSSSRPRA